jgi:transcription termination/antitermination protein NusG
MARWYIIHAYSGFENKVRDSIIAEAQRMGLSEAVEAVEVPTETVTEVKRGKKVQVERKFMPGYVLAKLRLTDDVYHLIKNTPKVTGFLGSGAKPQPISEREAARYFGGVEAARAEPKREIHVDYEIGDQVNQGQRRPLRQLQRRGRGTRLREAAGQGQRLDLRAGDAGGARLRRGRAG